MPNFDADLSLGENGYAKSKVCIGGGSSYLYEQRETPSGVYTVTASLAPMVKAKSFTREA